MKFISYFLKKIRIKKLGQLLISFPCSMSRMCWLGPSVNDSGDANMLGALAMYHTTQHWMTNA
jgi:hypothetical protein